MGRLLSPFPDLQKGARPMSDATLPVRNGVPPESPEQEGSWRVDLTRLADPERASLAGRGAGEVAGKAVASVAEFGAGLLSGFLRGLLRR
jgi:hypothetical protein